MSLLNKAKLTTLATPAREKASVGGTVTTAIAGFADLAALKVCKTQLEGLIKSREPAVKAAARTALLGAGATHRKKPDSMKIRDDVASGSTYVARRGGNRPLNEDEVQLLAEIFAAPGSNSGAIAGITEVVETTPELLAINPAYAEDTELLARVEKALGQVKGLPDDFIVMQPAVKATVVAETALDNLFQFHDPAKADQALDLLAGVILRPVFPDLTAAWNRVKPMMGEKVRPEKEEGEPAAVLPLRRRASEDLTAALKASLEAEGVAAVPARRRS